jgi:F-type H+-transporting ATPase subunit b
MLIDWFTVVAQVVNFLVLVALMKRFLWRRLVAVIDKREQRVAGQLAEAEAKHQEAQRLMAETRAMAEELDKNKAALQEAAKHDAEEQKSAMLRQAREEIQNLEAKWHEDLEREQAAFLDEVRTRAATGMLAVIRRALADLACSDIQHCALQVFMEKLKTLDAAAVRDLTGRELSVLTAGELEEADQRAVREALERQLGPGLRLKFERTQSFAWGIELRGNGRRIGWNSDNYIDSLKESLKEALEHRPEVLVA